MGQDPHAGPFLFVFWRLDRDPNHMCTDGIFILFGTRYVSIVAPPEMCRRLSFFGSDVCYHLEKLSTQDGGVMRVFAAVDNCPVLLTVRCFLVYLG